MLKMGSHEPFGHLQHKLWQKERSKVKLAVWLPTTKSRESTWPRCVQVKCNTSLESSWWGLQLCFRPHHDQMSAKEVMCPQSCGSPNSWNSGLSLGSPGTKSHLDVAPMENCRVYYVGEGGGFPQVRAMMSLVSPKLPVVCLNIKGAPESELTNLWLVGCTFEWVIEKLTTLPNPIPKP
jgi:hypothetical protein